MIVQLYVSDTRLLALKLVLYSPSRLEWRRIGYGVWVAGVCSATSTPTTSTASVLAIQASAPSRTQSLVAQTLSSNVWLVVDTFYSNECRSTEAVFVPPIFFTCKYFVVVILVIVTVDQSA